MFTFIWIFSAVILLVAAWVVVNMANQRKRVGQSGEAVVKSQQTGAGKPTVGRATGIN